MSRIIVGIDGSENAQPALEWAVREAALRDEPLTVITVNEAIASYWTGRPVLSTGDEQRVDKIREAAESEATEAVAKYGTDGKPAVTVMAVNGFAADTLINESKDADLLVIGTRGGGGFAHLSLGAVASKILHHAHCAVVLVPHER
jgi:nucleotide-binding universal stress UspA family protein